MSDPQTVAAALLDIEGTTTPIAFVTQVLFPYARAEMAHTLAAEWGTAELLADLARLEEEYAREESTPSSRPPWDADARRQSAERYLFWLMDQDRKSTALKSIQGRIWRDGYDTGRLTGQVYPDVPVFLKGWKVRGGRTYIFSSGSVLAQQLLFRRSDHGDLTLDQLGCQPRQPIDLTLRPTVFDRHVPPFDITGLTQAIAERLHEMFNCACRCAVEESNHRWRRLLRPRSQRPCE